MSTLQRGTNYYVLYSLGGGHYHPYCHDETGLADSRYLDIVIPLSAPYFYDTKDLAI
jgi:hypothetical protein